VRVAASSELGALDSHGELETFHMTRLLMINSPTPTQYAMPRTKRSTALAADAYLNEMS
jgi:hypothetical protein